MQHDIWDSIGAFWHLEGLGAFWLRTQRWIAETLKHQQPNNSIIIIIYMNSRMAGRLFSKFTFFLLFNFLLIKISLSLSLMSVT